MCLSEEISADKRLCQKIEVWGFEGIATQASGTNTRKTPVHSQFEIAHRQYWVSFYAQTKKPVVISRGMASLEELSLAVSILKEKGVNDIAILHCISAYPTKIEDLNLLTIPEIKNKFFDVVVGLSDHSLSVVSGAVAVALGAKIIERHFILNRKDGGPDAAFSLEPNEFSLMVKQIRETEKMLGKPFLGTTESEKENKQFRRSLWVIKDIKKGEVFTKDNVGSFRPAIGLEVKYLEEILGKKASCDIVKATPLTQDLIYSFVSF